MQRIQLQFFHVLVQVESDWPEVMELLKLDFWAYQRNDILTSAKPALTIRLFNTDIFPHMPAKKAVMHTQNALTFDDGDIRFCDYYGSLVSKIDFVKNEAVLYSKDLDKMHEVAYLLLLSRAGKILDIAGLHKLHAFAVSMGEVALVCMMPSKGGKSTLMSHLLQDSRVKMISDDIPLIDTFGRIHPMLLKIGLDEIPEVLKISQPDKNIYSMKRTLYGTKKLVCTRGLPDKIENASAIFSKIILIESFRFNAEDSRIVKAGVFSIFKGLFKHGVIGVGSPIIIEYFWQMGMKDFFVKTFIFFRRLFAFSMLAFRSKRFHLHSGKNPAQTANDLLQLMQTIDQEAPALKA